MCQSEEPKGKILRVTCNPLDTLGTGNKSAAHLRHSCHGICSYKGLQQDNDGGKHYKMRHQLNKIARIIKKIPGMPVVEINVTERHKGGQGREGINDFEPQDADTADEKITHRDTGADDMGPAEHQPPEKNHCLAFHKDHYPVNCITLASGGLL